MHDAAIRSLGLTRRFASLTAVDRLSFDVARGEIFGLVGPDGAGKTTTLRLLAGLLAPTEGEAWLAGLHIVRDAGALKDRIGYMAQRFGLYPDLTVDENMAFYADLFGVPRAQRAALASRLLAMTRLEPFRRRRAGHLSGGMKQKLALMCALLHRPEILLLDEPTTGVDPVSRRDFWQILRELAAGGITVLLATSYLDEAERCDRVALLYRGRLIQIGAPQALLEAIAEPCYEIEAPDLREAREALRRRPGVLSIEPAGPVLHAFLDPAVAAPERLANLVAGARFVRIRPSLEDVFIALIRRQGVAP
ncbi:MAG: ABC transporter ATP-binding protein [Bryobacterales bacterium]|nr:ABC transporter ATP-binding protein [Bryobacteraceae bacterium]MDW8355119.1 ABC transporter ATP-binding protein [Bryobacterales bacterium]